MASRPRNCGSIPGIEKEVFLFSKASRPVLGLSQPPVQWIPRALPRGYLDRSMKLTTNLSPGAELKSGRSDTSTPSDAFMTYTETAIFICGILLCYISVIYNNKIWLAQLHFMFNSRSSLMVFSQFLDQLSEPVVSKVLRGSQGIGDQFPGVRHYLSVMTTLKLTYSLN